ncbi:MAG: hypothetical protein HY904_11280 [Deltaproteobacteria bacterium]|nr:hypothetical protein [Deltaproteobacteria bacterium]
MARMEHGRAPPTTAAAIPSVLPGVTSALGPGAALIVPRDGMGYASLHAEVCPSCHARVPQALERFTLRPETARAAALEALLSPPAVLLASMALRLLGDTLWWPLVFLFGPSLALSTAAGLRIRLKRFRLKAALCPACAASIRAARRRVRVHRTLKNLSAWGMVMLAPVAFTPLGEHYRVLVAPLAAVLAGGCSVLFILERASRRRAAALLPALTHVDEQGALLQLPASWSGGVQVRTQPSAD